MRHYRAVWLVACAAVALVGVGVGLVRSPAVFAGAFFGGAVVAVASTVLVSRFAKRHVRASARRLIGSAVAAGAVAGAGVALGELLGAGAVVLAIVLLSVSPYLLRAYVRALTSVPVSMAAGLGAWVTPPVDVRPEQVQVPPPRDERLLTDQRLRGVWRTSFLVLQTRPRASEVLALAEERQRYLDEFERRNPRGFEAWLAGGAWASNIPVRYLRGEHTAEPEINWDDLTRQQDS